MENTTNTRLEYARIAIAHRVTNQYGKKMRPTVSGGALRVLLALVSSIDEGGRVRTAAGAGVLFGKREYYEHLAALIAAGYVRRIVRSGSERRHGEVTSTGQALAAKVGRLIETAAKEFISASSYVA
jgi:hypothetical protein